MSDVSDLLGGQYLSAENVQQPLLVTIAGADRVQLDGKTRLTVKFAELQKSLLCNKTNLGTVAQLFGNDTSQWVGRQIVLQAEPVQYQGKVVNGLRVKPYQAPVRPVAPQPAQPAAVVPVPPAPQQTVPVAPQDLHEQQPDSDVPF